MGTPLRRFASSPLGGGTAPVARRSRFHGAFWIWGLTLASGSLFAASPKVEVVAKDLQNPWGLAFIDGGRMLVTERPGRMRVVSPDGTVGEPIGGVPAVETGGQGGLLDVVADSQFARNRTVYFCFSEPGAGGNSTALASAQLSADASRLENLKVIFSQKPKVASRAHFGCRIVEARDQTLFLTLGDRFSRMADAQTLDNHLGKVVRVRKDGSVPPPTQDQVAGIAMNIYAALLSDAPWGRHFEPQLRAEVVEVLADHLPRDIKKSLVSALGLAALRGQRYISAKDLVRVNRRPSIGFLS